MIEIKFEQGNIEVTGGTIPNPANVRKKIRGFKAVQVPDDFTIQYQDRIYHGSNTDWILYNKTTRKIEIIPDARFNKVFEVV